VDVLEGLIFVHLLGEEIRGSWISLWDIPVVGVEVVGKRVSSRRANGRAKR
jgi:hypothetical protein